MPYRTHTAIAIGPEWSESASFNVGEDITKFDVWVEGVAVQLQWLEPGQDSFPIAEATYRLCRIGFTSIPLETPAHRYRIRQWPDDPNYNKKPCQVDVTDYS